MLSYLVCQWRAGQCDQQHLKNFGSRYLTFGITHRPDLMCLMSLTGSRIPFSSLTALKRICFRNLSSENYTIRHMQKPSQPLKLHLHFATSFQPTSRWSRDLVFLFTPIVRIPLIVWKQINRCQQVSVVFFARTGIHLWCRMRLPCSGGEYGRSFIFSYEQTYAEDDKLMKCPWLPLF